MEITQQIAMVLVVFALLAALVWFTRKRGMAALGGRRGKTRHLEPLERIQLTPNHAIHLVRVSGKAVLIATAPSTCTVLDLPITDALTPQFRQDLFATDK